MKKFIDKIRQKKEPRDHPPEPVGANGGPSEIIGYDIREKELSKIHKAAWNGDLVKVKQLAKKDPNSLDKEFR